VDITLIQNHNSQTPICTAKIGVSVHLIEEHYKTVLRVQWSLFQIIKASIQAFKRLNK